MAKSIRPKVCKPGSVHTRSILGSNGRYQKRCVCDTKKGGQRFLSFDVCAAAAENRLRGRKASRCQPGSTQVRAGRCTCLTRKGGIRFVKASKCE